MIQTTNTILKYIQMLFDNLGQRLYVQINDIKYVMKNIRFNVLKKVHSNFLPQFYRRIQLQVIAKSKS